MFVRKTSDLHMHLNGSFSMRFLEMIAKKNKCEDEFEKLKQLREQYQELISIESKNGIFDKSVKLIWAQFGLIHKIIQTLDDIHDGTIDVMENSKARYLEIRTTPKDMQGAAWDKYVDSFVAGLIKGNEKLIDKRVARGILSLDRTIHAEENAYQIIDRVVLEKKLTGMLVGIDISGNPVAERKLTGTGLANVIKYALSKNIGVAIHIGEADSDLEKSDIDVVLDVLTLWKQNEGLSNNNYFHGKVRLGHAIYLTDEQRKRIRELQIPVEVCPSCHEKINWWNKNSLHPITNIYKFWKDPVVSGTDDEFIFGGNAKGENDRVLEMLGFSNQQEKNDAREHQSQFRFDQRQ